MNFLWQNENVSYNKHLIVDFLKIGSNKRIEFEKLQELQRK